MLVFTCTYQAVLSRKVPSNYNEARNIMLAMLAITLEMLFVLPSFYYGSKGVYQQLLLVLINLVSATSTLICMYMPKMYIIFFRPSENHESLPHGTLGSFLQMDSVHKDDLPKHNDDSNVEGDTSRITHVVIKEKYELDSSPSRIAREATKEKYELDSSSPRNSTPEKYDRYGRNPYGERLTKRRKVKHESLNISKETTAFPMSNKIAVISP